MSDSDKTEQPTERKLQDSAEKGELPRSLAFTMGVSMGLWWLLLPAGSTVVLGFLVSYADRLLSLRLMHDELATRKFFLQLMATGVILPCAIGLVSAVLLGLVQSRGKIASKRSWFDLKRINPVSALMKFFGLQRMLVVLMSLIRMIIVAWVCFYLGRSLLADLQHTPTDQWRWTDLFMRALSAGWNAAGISVLACACLGVADLMLQIKIWKNQNKMSKQDVKRERRDQDGDPQVKAVRKSVQREMAQG